MALRLTDLNDYIAPSQTCIKPQLPSKSFSKNNSENIQVERADKVAVGITLNDCLACSGCITSAESVLISMQSIEEFNRFLSSGKGDKILVISISPQTISIFAKKYSTSPLESFRKLSWLFGSYLPSLYPAFKGKVFVFDTCLSRDFSLIETARDFISRYKTTRLPNSGSLSHPHSSPRLPLFTSACPGWICYAEKMHGSFILPFISTAKSPQQIMGSLVNDYFPSSTSFPCNNLTFSTSSSSSSSLIYHLSIMPCFDKKLEASRSDFQREMEGRDVDCVLSSLEVEDFITRLNLNFKDLPVRDIDTLLSKLSVDIYGNQILLGSQGTSAGGYLHFTIVYALYELFGKRLGDDGVRIDEEKGRNSDMTTFRIYVDEELKFTFVRAYGFRNIQNIIRQAKKGKCADFVEVMACPSGCINGGGQLKPVPEYGKSVNSPSEMKNFIADAEMVYQTIGSFETPLNEKVASLYDGWLKNDQALISKYLHTQYHNVEGSETSNVSTNW